MSDLLVEPQSAGESPPSGTIRLDGEYMEMLRYVVFHRRGPKGRRLRLNELAESLIGLPLRALYAEVKAEVEAPSKGRARKGDKS